MSRFISLPLVAALSAVDALAVAGASTAALAAAPAARATALTEAGLVDPNPPAAPKELRLPDTPIAAGSSTGYLPSSWQVDSSGQFGYSIPLDVPAGRAGMAPQLSLSYSSEGVDGVLGVGWGLSGTSSSIVRCGRALRLRCVGRSGLGQA